jgi:hypothetical protein
MNRSLAFFLAANVTVLLAPAQRATAQTVTRRWKEYFPGGMEMGDSDAAHLDRFGP